MTHYRLNTRSTACGKPYRTHRNKISKKRPVTEDAAAVTCPSCANYLAAEVDRQMTPLESPSEFADYAREPMRAFGIQKTMPRFWNIGPTGKAYRS